jgi:hypothetical protein
MKSKNGPVVFAIVVSMFGSGAQAAATKAVDISPKLAVNATETIAADPSVASYDLKLAKKPSSPCDAAESKHGHGASSDPCEPNESDVQPVNPYMGVGDGD